MATKSFASNNLFKKTENRTTVSNATYYEPIVPMPFTTRIMKQITENLNIDREVKESRTVFYLFGFLPLASSTTFKMEKQVTLVSSYFCELTPEMNMWVESIKPFCQELLRNRGKVDFRPTDPELNDKKDLLVYPFIVEYAGMTGIGWRRMPESIPEQLPV